MWDEIDIGRWKDGSVHVPNCKTFLFLQRQKGRMSGDARDFNSIGARAVIKFFFWQGKAPKEIHAILT